MIGIYKIQNTINNNIYIGGSNDILNRWKHHKWSLRNNKHHSKYLQRAWNKHGEDSFKFEVIEECSLQDLILKEQFYLDTLNPTYNINKTAENCTGRIVSETTKIKISNKNKGRKHTEITKTKISTHRKNNPLVFTEEMRKKISDSKKGTNNPNYGKPISDIHKEKIRQANKGKKISEETKQTIGRKNSISVVQLTLEGEFIKTWNSTVDVERELGFFGSGITKVCRGTNLTYKGYKWRYKKDFDLDTVNEQHIYTNKDGEKFSLLRKEASDQSDCLEINILRGNNSLYFSSSEEVDKFCELLQQRKTEIWKK